MYACHGAHGEPVFTSTKDAYHDCHPIGAIPGSEPQVTIAKPASTVEAETQARQENLKRNELPLAPTEAPLDRFASRPGVHPQAASNVRTLTKGTRIAGAPTVSTAHGTNLVNAYATTKVGPQADLRLTLGECTRIVHHALFRMNLASQLGQASYAKMMGQCISGQSLFNRIYYNCIFASKYGAMEDCAYKARGVDRSKTGPMLATRKMGDEGIYAGSAKEMIAVVYGKLDPRTTIDHVTTDMYLNMRDDVDRSWGEQPPADHHLPNKKSTSHVEVGGKTYWLVHEDFTDVQLIKIMHEETNGDEEVLCARFGNAAPLRTDRDYCAALIEKWFKVAIADR